MKFQPKSADDIKRESLIPTGEYDFEVIKAEDKVSKSGNEMIAIQMHVFVDGHARPCRDWLMEKMSYKLRHFCETTGLIGKYDAGEFGSSDCVGRTGKVSIVIKDSEEYGPQNSVKDYVVTDKKTEDPHYPPKAPQIPRPAPEDDPNAPPF